MLSLAMPDSIAPTRRKPREISREALGVAHPLALYRQRHALAMSQLARRAGIDLASLSRIERGIHTPSCALMLRLAIATKGEVSEIDIFRFHTAVQTGVVPRFRAPMTETYDWTFLLRPGPEPKPAAA